MEKEDKGFFAGWFSGDKKEEKKETCKKDEEPGFFAKVFRMHSDKHAFDAGFLAAIEDRRESKDPFGFDPKIQDPNFYTKGDYMEFMQRNGCNRSQAYRAGYADGYFADPTHPSVARMGASNPKPPATKGMKASVDDKQSGKTKGRADPVARMTQQFYVVPRRTQ